MSIVCFIHSPAPGGGSWLLPIPWAQGSVSGRCGAWVTESNEAPGTRANQGFLIVGDTSRWTSRSLTPISVAASCPSLSGLPASPLPRAGGERRAGGCWSWQSPRPTGNASETGEGWSPWGGEAVGAPGFCAPTRYPLPAPPRENMGHWGGIRQDTKGGVPGWYIEETGIWEPVGTQRQRQGLGPCLIAGRGAVVRAMPGFPHIRTTCSSACIGELGCPLPVSPVHVRDMPRPQGYTRAAFSPGTRFWG